MAGDFSLRKGHWAGWLEHPFLYPGWGPSPIYVTGVTALKSVLGLKVDVVKVGSIMPSQHLQ